MAPRVFRLLTSARSDTHLCRKSTPGSEVTLREFFFLHNTSPIQNGWGLLFSPPQRVHSHSTLLQIPVRLHCEELGELLLHHKMVEQAKRQLELL